MTATSAGTFLLARGLQPEPLIDVQESSGPILATAAVEERLLTEPVTFRADVVAEDTIEIAPPSARDGVLPRITSLAVAVGDQIGAGEVLLTVADRPVIALQGTIPMYRDIRPGSSGADVRQLQIALNELGYEVDSDGLFGRATESAAAQMYEDLGFDLPRTGGEEQLDALRDAVVAAEESGDAGAVSRSKQRLREYESTVGLFVPSGEISFLPRFPVGVLSIPQIGSLWDSEEETLVVTGSSLSLAGLIPAEVETLVSRGSTGEALVESTGVTFKVTVSDLDPNQVVDESGVWRRVFLAPVESIDLGLEGANLRVTIQAEASSSEVLAVPITAIYTTPDGQVFVMTPDGSEIPIEIGIAIGGWVEIVNSEFEPGDAVVIGFQR